MKNKITDREELKRMYVEIFLNNTDKVSKVSAHSAMNGISYGIAGIGQRALREGLLVESHINPDIAYGDWLDKIAENWGISARFGSSQSSTYVRIVGEEGTLYEVGIHIVSGADGLSFSFVEDFTIPVGGFGYAKIKSVNSGENNNVQAYSLNQVSPVPIGHEYIINEYMATGGRNQESDELFRNRIKEGANLLASGTLAKLEQIFMRINNDVLRVFSGGVDSLGNTIINIATQNGVDLSVGELDSLLTEAGPYLNLIDNRIYQNIKTYGLTLQNIIYAEINFDFRVKIEANYDYDNVRRDMQIRISKYFDFRFYENTGRIAWTDLFDIIKNTEGVEFISNATFNPNKDLNISRKTLPRVKSFLIRDLDGNLISDSQGNFMPIYYPNTPNDIIQSGI